jgi:hypothetical protein
MALTIGHMIDVAAVPRFNVTAAIAKAVPRFNATAAITKAVPGFKARTAVAKALDSAHRAGRSLAAVSTAMRSAGNGCRRAFRDALATVRAAARERAQRLLHRLFISATIADLRPVAITRLPRTPAGWPAGDITCSVAELRVLTAPLNGPNPALCVVPGAVAA